MSWFNLCFTAIIPLFHNKGWNKSRNILRFSNRIPMNTVTNCCFKHEVHVICFLTLQCLHMFSVVAGGPPPNLLTYKIKRRQLWLTTQMLWALGRIRECYCTHRVTRCFQTDSGRGTVMSWSISIFNGWISTDWNKKSWHNLTISVPIVKERHAVKVSHCIQNSTVLTLLCHLQVVYL